SAVTASCPSFSTMRRMPINWEGESSTMRMRAMPVPLVDGRIVAVGVALPTSALGECDQGPADRSAAEHALEHRVQARQRGFAGADPVQVARLPVGCQQAPDLVADVAGGAGGGDAQQRN